MQRLAPLALIAIVAACSSELPDTVNVRIGGNVVSQEDGTDPNAGSDQTVPKASGSVVPDKDDGKVAAGVSSAQLSSGIEELTFTPKDPNAGNVAPTNKIVDDQVEGAVSGDIYRLSIIPFKKRVLPPQLIVRSTSQIFNLDGDPRWTPQPACTSDPIPDSRCPNVADRLFCKGAMKALDDLYCDLGAAPREASSYLGASLTAGDVVALFRGLSTICSLKDPAATGVNQNPSLFGVKLGFDFGKSKRLVSDTMVKKFLALDPASPIGREESDYISGTLFGPTTDASTELFRGDTTANRDDFYKKLAAACTYLGTHPSRLSY